MPPDSCSWAMLSSRWVNYPENAILDLSSKKICQSSLRWATAQQIAEKQVTTEGAFFTIFHNSTIECHVTAPCPGELKWKMPPRVYSSCWRRRNGRGIVINATGVTTCWQQVSTWHVAAGNAAYLFTKPAATINRSSFPEGLLGCSFHCHATCTPQRQQNFPPGRVIESLCSSRWWVSQTDKNICTIRC